MPKLDKYDYHFISLKFLTAILLGLFFAFLLIYVFTPKIEKDYDSYTFAKAEIASSKQLSVFKAEEKSQLLLDSSDKKDFETKVQKRSFEIIESTKDSMLSVLTSRHLERINGLKDIEMLKLEEFENDLKSKRENLLQKRRTELEKDISENLRLIKRQVKKEYSSFSQQQIRDNYLEIINLKIAVEILAIDEAEKEEYQKELARAKKDQEELLADKQELVNKDISKKTRALIMEFNSKYSQYRDKLRNNDQKLITAQKKEINEKLNSYRKEILAELKAAKKEKAAQMDSLINKSKKYY